MFAVSAAAPTVAPTVAPVAPLPTQSFSFPQATWGSQHAIIMYAVQILFAVTLVGLIGLMSMQTTKTEGLSGTIGGRAESAYRGRLGMDQQVTRLTSGFAVAFIVLAIVNFLITR